MTTKADKRKLKTIKRERSFAKAKHISRVFASGNINETRKAMRHLPKGCLKFVKSHMGTLGASRRKFEMMILKAPLKIKSLDVEHPGA